MEEGAGSSGFEIASRWLGGVSRPFPFGASPTTRTRRSSSRIAAPEFAARRRAPRSSSDPRAREEGRRPRIFLGDEPRRLAGLAPVEKQDGVDPPVSRQPLEGVFGAVRRDDFDGRVRRAEGREGLRRPGPTARIVIIALCDPPSRTRRALRAAAFRGPRPRRTTMVQRPDCGGAQRNENSPVPPTRIRSLVSTPTTRIDVRPSATSAKRGSG